MNTKTRSQNMNSHLMPQIQLSIQEQLLTESLSNRVDQFASSLITDGKADVINPTSMLVAMAGKVMTQVADESKALEIFNIMIEACARTNIAYSAFESQQKEAMEANEKLTEMTDKYTQAVSPKAFEGEQEFLPPDERELTEAELEDMTAPEEAHL